MDGPGRAAEILDFWFGFSDLELKHPDEKWRTIEGSVVSEQKVGSWYSARPEFDEEIRSRFGPLLTQVLADWDHPDRGVAAWAASPLGTVALVLLLDQFTRNMFRNSPKAFESDAKAVEVATHAVERGLHKRIAHPVPVGFLFHPFEHAEDLQAQRKGVALFEELQLNMANGDSSYSMVCSFHDFAKLHLSIIERFGRFPHRNRTMGRESTKEEEEYLVTHKGF